MDQTLPMSPLMRELLDFLESEGSPTALDLRERIVNVRLRLQPEEN